MSDDGAILHHHRTVFDGWKSITSALYLTLTGYAVLVGVPVISTAWNTLLGFSAVEVGRVAGADLGGLSVGAVLAAAIVARVNRRLLIAVSALIAIGANGLCTVIFEYEQVLWLRFVAGFGSGIYTAVGVANLGATSKPARAFNLMLFAFAFTQAAEIHFLPQLTMNGIYTVFIVCYIVPFFFLHWIPTHPVDKGLDIEIDVEEKSGAHHIEHQHVPAYVPWLVLAAIVATYVNIGAYWRYIELASADPAMSTADPDWVGNILTLASFLSLLGCLFATVLSNRYGLARPLLVTLVVHSLIVGMLATGISNAKFLVSVFMFNFLWIFVDVYQMSTVANVDHSGRFAALMPAAQGLGQIIGPNLAASIIAWGYGYPGVFLMCASATMTGMAIYAYMYVRLRRTIPALADAS